MLKYIWLKFISKFALLSTYIIRSFIFSSFQKDQHQQRSSSNNLQQQQQRQQHRTSIRGDKKDVAHDLQKSKSYLRNDKKRIVTNSHGNIPDHHHQQQQQQQRRIDSHDARNVPSSSTLPHDSSPRRRDSASKFSNEPPPAKTMHHQQHQSRGRPSELSPRRRSDVSPRNLTQVASSQGPSSSQRQDLKKDNSGAAPRPGTYYSPERRKSASARPRQLPQPGEVPRRKSAAARVPYRAPPSSQSSAGGSSSGRSPSRSIPENVVDRNQFRKDSSPGPGGRVGGGRGGTGAADLSPSRRSDDGEEYRTPPDRSPNLSRHQQDFLHLGSGGMAADRSPTTALYYQSDKSPNVEEVYRTPPDRSPNRASAYHRSPVDGTSSSQRSPRDMNGHSRRTEASGNDRRRDTSPAGRATTTMMSENKDQQSSSLSSAMTLHPHDQPTSNPNYPAGGATQAGRRRSSSGQRLERQAAIVRERIEMHPDEITLGSDPSQKQGTTSILFSLFSVLNSFSFVAKKFVSLVVELRKSL